LTFKVKVLVTGYSEKYYIYINLPSSTKQRNGYAISLLKKPYRVYFLIRKRVVTLSRIGIKPISNFTWNSHPPAPSPAGEGAQNPYFLFPSPAGEGLGVRARNQQLEILTA
jgi:hypothetical protein